MALAKARLGHHSKYFRSRLHQSPRDQQVWGTCCRWWVQQGAQDTAARLLRACNGNHAM